MPIKRIESVDMPLVSPRVTPDTRTLGNILRLAAQQQAETAQQQGQNSGRMWSQMGELFQRFQQSRQQKAEQAKALEVRALERAMDEKLKRDEMGERANERKEAQRMRQEGVDRDTAVYTAENTTPGPINRFEAEILAKFPGTAARVRGQQTLPATVAPGALGAVSQTPESFDVLEPSPQQTRQAQLDTAAREREAQIVKDRAEDNARQSARDTAALNHQRVMESRAGQSSGPRSPIWVVGADGQFQDLAGVAPPGSKPANSREQGRAVTSGDAGDIAEFMTALDDVAVLRSTVTGNKATGTAAAIGAAMPNYITDTFGWGTEAKQKQAVIDRVKQVIGKALEGGVLRKEDETKYAKILPVISDVSEVVTAKLNGLEQAIQKRQQRKIDALSDAGYDVEKFRSRQDGPGVSAVPNMAGVKDNFKRTFKSGPFAGQTWAMVNGQPVKVQ